MRVKVTDEAQEQYWLGVRNQQILDKAEIGLLELDIAALEYLLSNAKRRLTNARLWAYVVTIYLAFLVIAVWSGIWCVGEAIARLAARLACVVVVPCNGHTS